jgi:pro-kumamolisin-like protein
MYSHTHRGIKLCLTALLLTLTLGIFSSGALAQRSINDADRVTLRGNTHPLARAEFDRGSAPAALPMNNMILLLSVRPDAKTQLDQLLAEQQDPKSPNFRKWLTPAEFGLKFGPTNQDIADATAWLQRFGFRIDEVGQGRMWINFSGTVQQVERAFQTNIRQYEVEGKLHHANAADPTIPRAFTGLVVGVVSMHDFVKHPNSTVNQLPPDFTAGNGANFLAPADFATIYNVNPLYGAAPAIDGTGQTIAIVGRTNINIADVEFFRSFFGLPAKDPIITLNGPDPGDLGGAEETEADLDVEWSGAVARNATINFVVSQTTATTDGVDLSAQFIVNNNVANVMSTSFGACEAALGATENNFWSTLWAQAAAQGITSFVSSGDSGAAGCDPATATTGTGLGVNGLSSTPFNISVGGTEFNEGTGTFWSATNDPITQASVLSYIPEVAWNESGNVIGGTGLFATGGGASIVYAKPAFQAGPGVPADSARDIPDVALSSASHDGYLIIQGHSATATGLVAVGGTSAASPSFAGIMALVVQKTGAAQGNANSAFYSMGQNQAAGATAVYHDTTSGDNSVPGVTGFTAGAGYDQATGWGSVDAASLVNFWNNNADFALAATPASQSVVSGGSTSFTATVTALGSYSGTVSFSVSGLPAGASATFTPVSVTGSGSSTLSITTTFGTTPAGSYPLTITATDGTLTHTAAVTLSVTDFALSAAPASQAVVKGNSVDYTANITALNGYAGTVNFSVTGLPPFSTAVFTPSSITGAGASTLTITTTSNTPAAIYSLTLTASDGTATHSVPLSLEVDPVGDFSMTISPASQSVIQGQNIGYGVTVSSLNGFTEIVTMSVSGLPAGTTATLTPNSVQGSGLSSLAIVTSFATPAGTYTFTVTGTSGPFVRTATATLIVLEPDFSLSASPASQEIIVGQSTSYSVSLSSVNGYAGTVSFSVSGLPANTTATFNPASLASSGTTTLSITTTGATVPGTYPLTITGTDGVKTHTASVTLILDPVPATDFSISAPPAITVKRNSSGSETVTITAINGFAGTVGLSISGLPPLVTATFNPTSITGSGTSSLTFVVDHRAKQGIYPLTVTGTSGPQSHSTSVTLTVN